MCSTGGLILILLIALFYNGLYTVVDATTSTTTSKVTTAASKSLTGAGHQTITTVKQEHPHRRQVEEKERGHDFENVSRHASTATNAPTNDYTRTDGRTSSSSGSGNVGHFIDITRKHKIHYNGLVVSEKTFFLNNLILFYANLGGFSFIVLII